MCRARLMSAIEVCLPEEIRSEDTMIKKERVALLQGCRPSSIEFNG